MSSPLAESAWIDVILEFVKADELLASLPTILQGFVEHSRQRNQVEGLQTFWRFPQTHFQRFTNCDQDLVFLL
jgi:hypothetical protein